MAVQSLGGWGNRCFAVRCSRPAFLFAFLFLPFLSLSLSLSSLLSLPLSLSLFSLSLSLALAFFFAVSLSFGLLPLLAHVKFAFEQQLTEGVRGRLNLCVRVCVCVELELGSARVLS